MARKAKKWYIVIVGKCPGIYDTWSETALLISGVPGAIHESFNTEEEARRAFAQARDTGGIKIVECGTPDEPNSKSGTAPIKRSSPRLVESSQPRRSPLIATAPPSPTTLHANVTYTRGPSSSSPHVSPRIERRASPRTPRVVVRTPPDIASYPSDVEEPSIPTFLSKSFSDQMKLEQEPQNGSTPSTPKRTKHSRRENLISTPRSYPSPRAQDDDLLSPLGTPRFFTPEAALSPVTPSQSTYVEELRAPHLSETFLYPDGERMVPLVGSGSPQRIKRTASAPATPFDPRSPMKKIGLLSGHQFSPQIKGRPSPDMEAVGEISSLFLSFAVVLRFQREMYDSLDSSDILFPASGSRLLSESPILPSSSSSHTGLGGDDLSLSELSLTDRTPLAHKPFSLLAPTKHVLSTQQDGSDIDDIDADVGDAVSDDEEIQKNERYTKKLREDKLQSDIFILRKLNASFASFNEALHDTGSANQDEDALEREVSAARDKAQRDAEEKALAIQQEEERRKREEQEEIEQAERQRVEREKKERTTTRGGVRGVRGTRASMRGTTRGTTRTGNL
ncbi:hypothetical protein DXG01_003882 [Tephrocybe rancida]|nr:hypothetical protein DXG01_003882 [Tephrocybe rancida]